MIVQPVVEPMEHYTALLQGHLLQQPGGEQGELPGRGAVRGPGDQPRRVAVLPLPPPRDHAGRPRRPGPGPGACLALGCLFQIDILKFFIR